jgi:hypothetical protein
MRTSVALIRTGFALIAWVFCKRNRMCAVICRGDIVHYLGMVRESLTALYLQVKINPCFRHMERQVDASLNRRSGGLHGVYSISTTCKHIIYILGMSTSGIYSKKIQHSLKLRCWNARKDPTPPKKNCVYQALSLSIRPGCPPHSRHGIRPATQPPSPVIKNAKNIV